MKVIIITNLTEIENQNLQMKVVVIKYRKKFRGGCQDRATKPNSVSLDWMTDYIHFHRLCLAVKFG